ncbi:MAG: ATP synthase subunit I [Burkholderiaceae bacterium]
MMLTVGLQVAVLSCVSVIVLLAFGAGHAGSLLLGGLCAIIPNALFAIRLSLHKGKAPESYPVVFFLGEFIKIGLTIAFLGAVFRWGGTQQWPAFIIGLVVALKVPLFSLWILGDKSPVPAPEAPPGGT